MQWSETVENKVAKSTRYHQHDALIYALDCIPPPDAAFVPSTWQQEVRKNDEAFRKARHTKAIVQQAPIQRRSRW